MLTCPHRLGSYFEVVFGLKTPPDNSVLQAKIYLFCCFYIPRTVQYD